MNLASVAAAAMFAMVPVVGVAAPVNLDLTSGPSDLFATRTITDSVNEMDVTISSAGRDGALTFGQQGLGVMGGAGQRADARINRDEIVRFDFGRGVSGLRVSVGAINGDPGRSYTLVGSNGIGEEILPTSFPPEDKPEGIRGNFWNVVSLSNGAPIESLFITTTTTSPTAGFSVRSLYYDGVESAPKVAPVPLPAAGLLLGGGLAFFGWVGRRKQAQT